jgi:hypothetical protein
MVKGKEVLHAKRYLATGISQSRCKRLGVGYMDPAKFRGKALKKLMEDPDVLVVDHAGQVLYLTERQKLGKVAA